MKKKNDSVNKTKRVVSLSNLSRLDHNTDIHYSTSQSPCPILQTFWGHLNHPN